MLKLWKCYNYSLLDEHCEFMRSEIISEIYKLFWKKQFQLWLVQLSIRSCPGNFRVYSSPNLQIKPFKHYKHYNNFVLAMNLWPCPLHKFSLCKYWKVAGHRICPGFTNSVIAFIMVIPCHAVANVSAFSRNSRIRAVTAALSIPGHWRLAWKAAYEIPWPATSLLIYGTGRKLITSKSKPFIQQSSADWDKGPVILNRRNACICTIHVYSSNSRLLIQMWNFSRFNCSWN